MRFTIRPAHPRWPVFGCMLLAGLASATPIAAADFTGELVESRLAPADGAGTRFGRSNAIIGNHAFVGDDWQSSRGAIYVYQFDGNEWRSLQKLVGDLGESGDSGDQLANSMAVDRDLLVAGAPEGRAAYVFRYDGAKYIREAVLRPADPAAGLIGTSVGVSGNRIVVSGLQRFGGGVTYVYEYAGGRWRHAATLTVPDASSVFGHCAVQDDTVVIGDTIEDFVSIFEKSASGWTESDRIRPAGSDPRDRINFGLPVRIDGDVIAVGAVWDDEAGSQAGAAYVFERGDDGWQQAAKFTPVGSGAQFGGSLALESRTLIAGAVHRNTVFVFQSDGRNWSTAAEVRRQAQDVSCDPCRYGMFAGLSGERFIVGEMGANLAWIYESGDDGWVSIDVQPWSDRNLVDPNSTRLVAVAIHGSMDFDALQCDHNSLRLNPGDARSRNYRVMDTNRDGFMDLLTYFRSRELLIACGESEVELTGATHQGMEFHGDNVVTNRRCR